MWHWSIRLYDRQHQIENKQTYPTTINVTPKQGSLSSWSFLLPPKTFISAAVIECYVKKGFDRT